MATIAKFYLLDATSPNTGTMPSSSPTFESGNPDTGDATGASTARDATDVAGASNPDVESSITALANQNAQAFGHRRFVSRPLAAHTFASGDGSWTFSYARSQSNANHNCRIQCQVYCWRPGTGARVGGSGQGPSAFITGATLAVTAETADSATANWGTTSVTIQDGDILVFDVIDSFTQSMSTAYTSQFAYDGTTEASTTTCASFVTPPAALTLFTAVTTTPPLATVVDFAVARAANY